MINLDNWTSVQKELPEVIGGVSYQLWNTDIVLVIHKDRPDYPVTAHAILGENPGIGIRIPTYGVSKHPWICWYSAGRNLCNPFDKATSYDGSPMRDGRYDIYGPNYFGIGITHWKYIT